MAAQSRATGLESALRRAAPNLWLAAGLLTLVTASSVAAALCDRWAGDVDGMRLFQGMLNGATEPLADAVTALGDRVPRLALGLVSAGWLLYVRRPRLVGMLVVVLVLAGALVQVLKWTVDRPRPELPLDLEALAISTSGSFPSGHTTFVALYFGALAYLTVRNWRAAPWRRGALVVLFLAPVVLIGPSRIAWGIHWPSDVLGGYLVALLGLQALALLHRRFGEVDP